MKKLVTIAAIVAMGIGLAACAKSKVIDGVEYQPYGIINEDEHRNPNIQYELVVGNVIWSVILCETIIAPIYFLGWSIMQPVGKKVPPTERH